MKPSTRKRVLTYGIPVDLIILATGVGLLLPSIPALGLIAVYAVAVLLSSWKSGWRGGVTATVFGAVVLLALFGDRVATIELAWFAAAGLIISGGAAVAAAQRTRPVAEITGGAAAEPERLARVINLRNEEPAPAAAPSVDAARIERELRKRFEREAAERESKARAAGESAAAARFAKEKKQLTANHERERAQLKDGFEAERRKSEAARLSLQKQLDEAARKPPVVQTVVDKVVEKVVDESEVARRVAAREAELRREHDARAEATIASRVAEVRATLEAQFDDRVTTAAESRATELRTRLEAEFERRVREAADQRASELRASIEAEFETRVRDRVDAHAAELRGSLEAEFATRVSAAADARAAELRASLDREFEQRVNAAADARAAELRTSIESDFEQRVSAAADAHAAELRTSIESEFEQRVNAAADARAAELRASLEQDFAAATAAAVAAARAEQQPANDGALSAERESIERAAELRVTAAAEARIAEQRTLLETHAAAELERVRREGEERLAALRAELEQAAAARVPVAAPVPVPAPVAAQTASAPEPAVAPPPPHIAPERSLLSRIFSRKPEPQIRLNRKTITGENTAIRRAAAAAESSARTAPGKKQRKPRILFLETRRATAENAVPKLRQSGIEVSIVDRLVDAVDEIYRFRPDVFFLDAELPDFDKAYRVLTDQSKNLPIVLTARNASSIPRVRRAGIATRPYTIDEISEIARTALATPQSLLASQTMPPADAPRGVEAAAPRSAPQQPLAMQPARTQAVARPQPLVAVPVSSASGDETRYEVTCFNCRITYDASEADWCSCLTKERTVVCTNCLTCFCKASPSFKEKFWLDAPARLFERKTAELRRQSLGVAANPAVEDVKRPLVMLVEDDEDIQAIVQRVCSNLNYGFVSAGNGQDGLALARAYHPNLILSDAFMPKLDGREMCRMLKEEPAFAATKMIVMTGLYTDTKYKSEALKRFHIDDYLSKPVSITDLINLLQRHLEGVTDLPPQEDLHELHRQEVSDHEQQEQDAIDDGVPLAALLDAPDEAAETLPDDDAPPQPVPIASRRRPNNDAYEVSCFTCSQTFEATNAEWCTCLGRDNTLVCEHCGNCFCKAPAAYRERFWVDAPSTLFERKMIGSKRSVASRLNPPPEELKRPLILLVEDDENIQLIVKTVVTSMGYGFIVGANGQEGLALAREYNPELILSDAFMPKLDGREMCRLLKEDPATARSKAIIMTGLYTDRKYRNEALSYFKVDDYVAKPLAVDDLIRLMKKHLPQEVQAAM